jgi:hypothetical protein
VWRSNPQSNGGDCLGQKSIALAMTGNLFLNTYDDLLRRLATILGQRADRKPKLLQVSFELFVLVSPINNVAKLEQQVANSNLCMKKICQVCAITIVLDATKQWFFETQ